MQTSINRVNLQNFLTFYYESWPKIEEGILHAQEKSVDSSDIEDEKEEARLD